MSDDESTWLDEQAPVWRDPTARRERRMPRRRQPTSRREDRRPLRGLPTTAKGRVFAAVAIVIWFLFSLFQPLHGAGSGHVTVTIPMGASTSSIGDELARDGVVSSSFFFKIRAELSGDRGKFEAGTYQLKHGMSYSDALVALTSKPAAAPTTNVTTIPGHTLHQIAIMLHRQGIHGQYITDTRTQTVLDPSSYGAPKHLTNLEGFLFPSTYQLRTPVDVHALVNDQMTAFRQQFATVNMAYARSKNLTPYDVLKIASIVEAEAGIPSDRPLIASVIYNRLHLGMSLGIDATTRYAVGNYSSPLTDAQLADRSPYNTRLHTGLPPTPIDNPSLDSIQATAHPAHTHYLYFVAKPCGNGASMFATNLNQFNQESAQYAQARAARGGRSPLQC